MRPAAAARGVSFALALLEPCARAGIATRTSVLPGPFPSRARHRRTERGIALASDGCSHAASYLWLCGRSSTNSLRICCGRSLAFSVAPPVSPVCRSATPQAAKGSGGTQWKGSDRPRFECLSPLKLCQFLVSSEGGFDGSEASFGRGLPAAVARD